MATRDSTAPKAHSRKPARRKRRPVAKLPDLEPILSALFDANALVSVAMSALAASNHSDLEETVLRVGVNRLQSVYDQLDAANVQLAQIRTKHAGTVGGAS